MLGHWVRVRLLVRDGQLDHGIGRKGALLLKFSTSGCGVLLVDLVIVELFLRSVHLVKLWR